MTLPAILAIDLGTTRLKVAAFTSDGTLLAREAARNLEQRAPGEDGPSRSWQSPDRWWRDTCALTRQLLARPDDGGFHGTSRFGYRWDRDAQQLVVVEEQARTVRLMHDLYVEERLGTARIADELSRRGVPTPAAARGWRNGAGKPWAAEVVAKMLHHDYSATTLVRVYDGRPYEYAVAPLVTPEVTAAVKEIRASRPTIKRRSDGSCERVAGADARTGDSALLQGRMRCALCGRRGRVGLSGNARNRHLSYHCAGRLKYGRKPGEPPWTNGQQVTDRDVVRVCVQLMSDPTHPQPLKF